MAINDLRMARHRDQLEATMQLAAATQAAGKKLYRAIQQIIAEGAAAALAARLKAYVRVAIEAHRSALQGHYWLRPMRWRTASGLLLVDLRNGRWIEIPTQVREGIVKAMHFFDSRPTLLAGRVLVTKGISLDPRRWRDDGRVLGVVTVHRSLIAYDMPRLRLHSASQFATSAWSRVR